MERIDITVLRASSDKRLDRYLVEALKRKYSRSFIKKLIDNGDVLLNGKSVSCHKIVSVGDSITVMIPAPQGLDLKPENISLDILYEDEELIVINKPKGLLCHPVGRQLTGTLVNALLYHCKELSGIGGVLRPGIVHRLDKETSGVMVCAKTGRSHIELSRQFKEKKVKRKYIALVKGIVQLDNGRIEFPLARRYTARKARMRVSFVDKNKKSAITRYRVIRRFKNFTMLELSPETGRTHQIRVHLAHIGHPVLGDRLYGNDRAIPIQALHAKVLGFVHPVSGRYMEFTTPLPEEMEMLIRKGEI